MVTLLPDIVARVNRLTWLGRAIVVLGVLAILAPLMAGKATVILVALLLLLAGLAQLFDALRSGQSTSSRVLTLVLGATATVAAIFNACSSHAGASGSDRFTGGLPYR
jgi:uncharacterized membrane protein HdeD (DUF308 family)